MVDSKKVGGGDMNVDKIDVEVEGENEGRATVWRRRSDTILIKSKHKWGPHKTQRKLGNVEIG